MLKKLVQSQPIAIGLALFSMFFGAGNIIFPLAVGLHAGDKNLYAISGLLLTAALMPILGVIAMILYRGNYSDFFGRLGKIPGFLLAFFVISLLGPLGSTPRCIALSYTTLKSSLFEISPVVFGAITCGLLFVLTVKKRQILNLLGWILTPLLLASLTAIILVGLFTSSDIALNKQSNGSLFIYGLKEGYNTMDLLAAFFFSSTILQLMQLRADTNHSKILLGAAFVGALLLSLVYVGFSFLAAFHGSSFQLLNKDQLLAAITQKIAGPYAGILVNSTIALACLTTAIALITAFSYFVQKELFKEKVSYATTLAVALLITFFVSTFEFTGISTFLGPILQILYPGLILLTLLNILHRLKGFAPVKWPVFTTFLLTTLIYYLC